jgi:uncharacterized protein (TIGR02145 family)/uncharacterized repeat protein (TIGR02543 family)
MSVSKTAVPKKLLAGIGGACALLCLIAAMSAFFCTETSDNCGQGRKLNAYTEFCYNGEAYAKCGGETFDPPTQFCYDGKLFPKCGGDWKPDREFCYKNVAYTKCAGQEFNPDNEFCFFNSDVYDKCNGKEFDPANGCNNDITLPKCGGFYYNPQLEFCDNENGITYQLCNGKKYTPPNNPCGLGYGLTTKIEPQGWGTVSVPALQNYPSGTQVSIRAIPNADSGGIFVGWSGASSSTGNPVTITMNSDTTLTANFRWPKLSVVASPDTGGSVSYEPKAEYYPVGTEVKATATATSASGYGFMGWSGASTDTAKTVTITMNRDITLTANFKRFALNVNVSPAAGGSLSYEPNLEFYPPGTEVTVTAVPASGYNFINWSNWSEMGSTTDTAKTVTVTMDRDRTPTANFAKTPTLTINVLPENSGTVSYTIIPPSTMYDPFNLKVKAIPAEGYMFSGWTDVNGGYINRTLDYLDTGTIREVSPGGNVTVTANFGQISKIESENIIDARDGKTYKTVIIGGAWFGNGSNSMGVSGGSGDGYRMLDYKKRWMAQNLNYQTSSGSWCYGDDNSNCTRYGRLYNWNTATTACPAGWRLPSYQEWSELAMLANGMAERGLGDRWNGEGGKGGKMLKAKSPDWDGTDDYGFSALPGGDTWAGDQFNDIGKVGHWWTATDTTLANGDHRAYRRDIYADGQINKYEGHIVNGYSVRCVQDD